MIVTLEQCLNAYKLATKSKCDAANYLLRLAGSEERLTVKAEAESVLYALYYSLLTSGAYSEAATLAWGDIIFNTKPQAVQKIWKLLNDPTESMLLIMGGGSQGKTVTTAGWAVQWWEADPMNTTGKIISTTKGHATSGIVAKCINFWKSSIFPLLGQPVAGGLEILGDKAASILAIALPEGDTGEGRLTGFHPMPRPTEHPIFGSHGRVFAVVDEADQVPEGLWKGLDNMLGSVDDKGSVKVVCLTNPRNKSNPFAYRAEPVGGWNEFDETSETWISKEGWRVLRLDPQISENIVQKKVIFPGFMTYKYFRDLERRGRHDPSYMTYGRSLYPEGVAEFTVMGASIFDDVLGRFSFEGTTTPVASLDPAFSAGGADAVLTSGVYGKAIAFTPFGGEMKEIRPQNVIQVEQQIKINKGKTQEMGRNIMAICKGMGVRPEWFIMDMTGNGRGLYDWLSWQWGGIVGVEWGSEATEFKILEEDTQPANVRFKGIKTEMYFATGIWVENGYMKFSPSMATFAIMRDQCCLVQWHWKQTMQEVETKEEFKAKNKGNSPDNSDSIVMLPHLIRIRAQARVTAVPPKKEEEQRIREEGKLKDTPDGTTQWIKV